MDWLTFISKLIEFLAWPIALTAVALILKKEIKALLPLITKLEAGPLKVEMARLEKKVEAVEEKTDVVIDKMGMNESDDPQAVPPARPSKSGDGPHKSPPPAPPAPSGRAEGSDPDDRHEYLQTGARVQDSPLTRLQILNALDHPSFAMRSLSGIASDTGMHPAAVRAILGILMNQGLVSETINSTGKIRYFLTSTGTQAVLLARVNLPTGRPGKIGES